MTPKICVLLATYNGAKFIEEQLTSILWQQGVIVDIYVSDDGSTDCTLAKIVSFTDARVKCLGTTAGAGSAAGNFFRLLSDVNFNSYDYVSFSDQDDIWHPDKLCNAVEMIQTYDADAYSSDLIAFDNSKNSAFYIKKHINKKKFDYLFQGASAGCTYVLKKETANFVLGVISDMAKKFPPNHSHDWLIYAICRSHGLEWVHDSRAFIAYRQHSANVFGAMPGVFGLFKRLKMFRNGWYREEILWHRQFLVQNIEEVRIFNALSTLKFKDRIYLASRCFEFRRSVLGSFLLLIAILLGFL